MRHSPRLGLLSPSLTWNRLSPQCWHLPEDHFQAACLRHPAWLPHPAAFPFAPPRARAASGSSGWNQQEVPGQAYDCEGSIWMCPAAVSNSWSVGPGRTTAPRWRWARWGTACWVRPGSRATRNPRLRAADRGGGLSLGGPGLGHRGSGHGAALLTAPGEAQRGQGPREPGDRISGALTRCQALC